MKILVTGGAGYIGAIATSLLRAARHEVAVIDTLENGHKHVLDPNITFFECNIADAQRLDEVLTQFKPDGVIHFAAYALVEESIKDPQKYYENNVYGSHVLFSTLIKHGVKNIVFSSSCATYGIPEHVPIDESQAQNPINPYGESKLVVERMLKWYSQAYDLNAVCLRYFNVAGASFDGTQGENHRPETHLIPNVFKAAIHHQPILVNGHDYDTPDGTCVRDYVHVVDLARAHILVLEQLHQGKKLQPAYNIGSGQGHSNQEVIAMVKKVTGLKIKVEYKDRRPGDPAVLVANPEAILRDLGFKTEVSDLETIIKTAWKWYRTSHVLGRVKLHRHLGSFFLGRYHVE